MPSSMSCAKTCGAARSAKRSPLMASRTAARSAWLSALDGRRGLRARRDTAETDVLRRRSVDRLTPSTLHVARSDVDALIATAASIRRSRRTRGSCTPGSRAPLLFFGCPQRARVERSCAEAFDSPSPAGDYGAEDRAVLRASRRDAFSLAGRDHRGRVRDARRRVATSRSPRGASRRPPCRLRMHRPHARLPSSLKTIH